MVVNTERGARGKKDLADRSFVTKRKLEQLARSPSLLTSVFNDYSHNSGS